MDPTSKTLVFQYNSDTVKCLRKLYGLDTQERLNEAIDVLVKWLQKQEHLIKKDYSREYLERSIILSKGSLERVKMKLDKVATFKTLLPEFYEALDIKNCEVLKTTLCTLLPKLTKDHERVFIIKNTSDSYPNLFDIYKYIVLLSEFIQAYDYCKGAIVVFDPRECNLLELIKAINLLNMRQTISIITDGYKLSVKAFHFLTTSKAIDTLLTLFKQAVSPKLRQRIYVHRNVESLCEHIPKDILPKDFGGNEKTTKELADDLIDAISSEEFTEFFEEMREARSNEAYRSDEKFNDQCMGMPGSFRKLTVD